MNFKEMVENEFEFREWIKSSLSHEEKKAEIKEIVELENGEYTVSIKFRNFTEEEIRNNTFCRNICAATSRMKPEKIYLGEIRGEKKFEEVLQSFKNEGSAERIIKLENSEELVTSTPDEAL